MKSSSNDDLPEDLEREVLLRLPVKILLQCKCVCKGWCALIGSRSFIDDHFGHQSNQDCLLIQHSPYRSQQSGIGFAVYTDDGRHLRNNAFDYMLNMFFGYKKTCDLLRPANGVFCAVRRYHERIALFNPATNKFKPLPPIPFHIHMMSHVQVIFRFDSFSGDFKVVAFLKQRKKNDIICVYNSSSDSWRITKVVDWLNKRIFVPCSEQLRDVFFNGVFHWINMDTNLMRETIVSFDTRNENFQEILLPEAAGYGLTILVVDITVYGDSLALLLLDEEGQFIDKWVMGRDGLWTTSFRIDLHLGPIRMWPLSVWKKNDMLFETERVTETKQCISALFLCDIATLQVRIFGPEFYDVQFVEILSYKESLVSIEGERDRAADHLQDFFDYKSGTIYGID